jgi:hypothetical protein
VALVEWIPDHSSIFSAEAMAVLLALKSISHLGDGSLSFLTLCILSEVCGKPR